MKDLIQTTLIITGLIPGSYLVYLCLLVLTSDIQGLTLSSILGILGFVGLFLLLLEHRVKDWLLILLLSSGIASLIVFLITSGITIRNRELDFDLIFAWVLLIWPSIVALINIIRISLKHLIKNNEK